MTEEILIENEIAAYVRYIEVEKKRHNSIIDALIERLNTEDSIIVGQKVIFKNYPEVTTTITFLPVKRYYKSGSKIVSDDYLLKEIQSSK